MQQAKIISKQDIEQAHQRIKPYINHTPILSSTMIAEIFGCEKFSLKCQNFQKTGAFKPRGVFNKLRQLSPTKKVVCTQSSGNNAAALAYVSKKLNYTAKIIMPQNSPEIKRSAVQGYNAQIYMSGNTIKQRQQKCLQIQNQFNAILVHPYNDIQIITGQATCGKEILQSKEHQQLNYDFIVCPIGGGGLMSGTLLSGKYFGSQMTKVIGVEPYLARDAYDSVKSNSNKSQYPPITIADGLRTPLGSNTFRIIQENLSIDDIILVEQEQIIEAMRLIFERMKLVIEPSSATVVAAVKKDPRFKGKRVCCIVSGGNVDLSNLWKSFQGKVKQISEKAKSQQLAKN